MLVFNIFDCKVEKSTDLKILNYKDNYIGMLIVIDKSYVYTKKFIFIDGMKKVE